MTGGPRRPDRTALMDRHHERDALERLLEAVRAGESRVLVVCGDPGVGKTALLEYLAEGATAAGCRVARAVGVQSEMELAFAGLHQLCAPMLDHATRLPTPQHEALRTAFGIAAGTPPDGFLVGLAVLSLLSDVAGKSPLICVIDDAQWLDQASAQVAGVRGPAAGAPTRWGWCSRPATRTPNWPCCPSWGSTGCGDDDARALLRLGVARAVGRAGPRPDRGRDPREPPCAAGAAARAEPHRAGRAGSACPAARRLTGRIEDSFTRRLTALPAETQRLL